MMRYFVRRTGSMKASILPIALLFAGSAISSGAIACTMYPPMREVPASDLVRNADLVAIVHVEKIVPMSAVEEAELQRLMTDPPLNTPIKLPGPSARFSAIRILKGKLPEASLLRSGPTNCDVVLTEGSDYVLFARSPRVPGGQIVPLYGTFPLGADPQAKAKLAEVESILNPPNPTRP